MTGIQHVLFDADGVLQDVPGAWYLAMERHLGDRARDFLHQTWADELPTLAAEQWEHGQGHAALGDLLGRHGISLPG